MRELSGFWKFIGIFFVSILVAATIYTSLAGAWHPVIQGSIFLSFAFALVFLYFPLSKSRLKAQSSSFWETVLWGRKNSPAGLDIVMMIASFIVCGYVLWNWEEITRQRWMYQPYELVFSAFLGIMLLEATRRTTGKIIPIMAILFLLYALFGDFIPGFFGHPGFPLREILYHFYMMTEGYWGLLTDLTCRVIAIFLLLGPVLFATGVGDTFMNLARYFGGRISGGAGQIAVISSACFGTLSGSAVANVATTGTFTIPTMKKLGYKPELAGAIEASASSGGQIMPPIMGVGAFVMAEMLGIPYLYVCVAAIIPALIYFFGVGAGVFFSAKKYGLGKVPAELMPKTREVFDPAAMVNLFIPIGILLYILILLLPAQLAAAFALIAAMGTFLISRIYSPKQIWGRTRILARALSSGAITALATLMVMAVCVQMAVSLVSLTGLAVKMSEAILSLAGVNVLLALFFTMVIIMILGMGMPTTAAYIIGAAVLGSTLIGLEVKGLPAHMFIFYYSVLGNISPPVCVAVYTAVTISGGNWLRMAVIAMSLCLGSYLIPFTFVYYPALLMQGEPLKIISTTLTALTGVLFLSAGIFGYFARPTNIFERLLFIAGGLLLFKPGLTTDLVGATLIASAYISQRLRRPNLVARPDLEERP
ncbi:MAG: TRAP transporter fused permease subunit [Deltaproteobacteria bacterium]|nr:TRAP transporter fused permease subunit [Deltaproteobacteria bacterium]